MKTCSTSESSYSNRKHLKPLLKQIFETSTETTEEICKQKLFFFYSVEKTFLESKVNRRRKYFKIFCLVNEHDLTHKKG